MAIISRKHPSGNWLRCDPATYANALTRCIDMGDPERAKKYFLETELPYLLKQEKYRVQAVERVEEIDKRLSIIDEELAGHLRGKEVEQQELLKEKAAISSCL